MVLNTTGIHQRIVERSKKKGSSLLNRVKGKGNTYANKREHKYPTRFVLFEGGSSPIAQKRTTRKEAKYRNSKLIQIIKKI